MSEQVAPSESVWLIGASSGIGKALIDELDHPSMRLFISARNQNELERLSEKRLGQVTPVALDMTDDASVAEAAEVIRGHSQSLNRVIVNAGTCEYMDSWTVDLKLVERVMQTNFFGVLKIVNAALPFLRQARSDGSDVSQLVLMSSSVSYQALPRAHAYGASKSALRYFAECLKIDLQHEGIDVRVVSPGFVKTPLTDRNDFPMPFLIEADEAARRIVSGMHSGRFDIAFPRRFTWILRTFANLPQRLKFSMLAKTSRHPDVVSDHKRNGAENHG